MKKILILICSLAISYTMNAAQCDLSIRVEAPTVDNEAWSDVNELLQSRIIRLLNAAGYSAGDNYGQLYLTWKITDIFKDQLPGPPTQTVVRTQLTLRVGDIMGDKTFASETFELRGVGTSEQRAYINALSSLNARNSAFESFIRKANDKTLSYFNANYATFLSKARAAAGTHDYEKAIYYAGLIPACCVGYEQAERDMLKYYGEYLNLEGEMLLNKAKACFAASPNADGANEAFVYLNGIHPSSSVYSKAQSYAETIARQTKSEYDFEIHQKYNDSHDLKMSLVDAARQVGVAYGQGQKSSTTNILWH